MEAKKNTTESLCPVCLAKLPATIRVTGGTAILEKRCPQHGHFETPVWRGEPAYDTWQRPKIPQRPRHTLTRVEAGCPHDCGLCPAHRQRSCTILLEVTQRCNLNCPVCYADAGRNTAPDPTIDTIAAWFETARTSAPQANIQLSGGEPTVRDDLSSIIVLGRAAGFAFIQLNTNGVRIAQDDAYLDALKNAGLTSIFLQFDGVDDAVYKRLRGRALLDIKLRAIQACTARGIGVVLTPTLVPGINTDAIGGILDKAIELSPGVRAVHFQPMSYFGRYFTSGEERLRLTLPELMQAIEIQSKGRIKAAHFKPPGCENARCSFHGSFLVMPGRRIMPLQGRIDGNCCSAESKEPPGSIFPPPIPATEGAARAMAYVRRQWAAPAQAGERMNGGTRVATQQNPRKVGQGNLPSLDDFITRAKTHSLSVSAMAFQDAWNVDLERVRDCCIHVMSPDRRLIPFCLYNLTASDGRRLNRQ